MSKICVIGHSIDLDGWMSMAIVKKYYEDKLNDNKLTFIPWNYGNDIPDLTGYNKVIMVDITFPAKIMKELHRKFTAMKGYSGEGNKKQPGNFIWIDHHASAIKDMENEYQLGNSIPISMPFGVRDTDFAACELTWKYFFSEEPMPEIVRLLGRYDCFGHKGTDEEQKVLEFQYGARSVITNHEEAYDYLMDSIYCMENHPKGNIKIEDDILRKGRNIYKYLCTEAKQIYARAFPIKLTEEKTIPRGKGHYAKTIISKRKFLCVNRERFNPINFGIDYHKNGYDGFACFWYKDKRWNWSLYSDNGKVNCSAIAKQYGGGGHFSASGFVCDSETLLEIIKKR